VALARGARRVVMVDSLEQALAHRRAGLGRFCIGERRGARPPDFDFGNSPVEMASAEVAGDTLIQTTTNGTAGIAAARAAERIYAGAFVSAEATVRAIQRHAPAVVSLVAMGREGGIRADEDELCALYLRSRLEGRQPDQAAIRALLACMPPPPNGRLVASGAYDLRDRDIAAEIDRVPFAIRVRQEDGLMVAMREE
jgi:2-phosphosulfolactate phosphatase